MESVRPGEAQLQWWSPWGCGESDTKRLVLQRDLVNRIQWFATFCAHMSCYPSKSKCQLAVTASSRGLAPTRWRNTIKSFGRRWVRDWPTVIRSRRPTSRGLGVAVSSLRDRRLIHRNDFHCDPAQSRRVVHPDGSRLRYCKRFDGMWIVQGCIVLSAIDLRPRIDVLHPWTSQFLKCQQFGSAWDTMTGSCVGVTSIILKSNSLIWRSPGIVKRIAAEARNIPRTISLIIVHVWSDVDNT
jgi:hypothetical protein